MSGPSRHWSATMPLAVGFLALAALLGGFGLWSTQARIAGAVLAPGQIEVEQNRQVVQHPDGGVVDKILVKEGDVVAEGAVLIRLDPARVTSELNVTESQLYEIRARKARLAAERDDSEAMDIDADLEEATRERPAVAELIAGQMRLFQARRASEQKESEQLERRGAQILNQIEGIEAQQTALRRQLDLIAEELGAQQSLLDRGLAQASRVLALRREEARLSGQVGELTALAAESRGRITELEIQKLKLGTTRREAAIAEIRDLQFREVELAERRLTLKQQLSRMNIRAPAAGIVYGLEVFAPRSVIRPAEPVLYIVPQDRPLIVSARISPSDVDEVFVGQTVTLRLSALGTRDTPELRARVTVMSADAFVDKLSGTPFYRAEIRPERGEMEKLGEGVLIPGMPAEAYIRTSERTPLAYLVKPFTDYFAKAFRES